MQSALHIWQICSSYRKVPRGIFQHAPSTVGTSDSFDFIYLYICRRLTTRRGFYYISLVEFESTVFVVRSSATRPTCCSSSITTRIYAHMIFTDQLTVQTNATHIHEVNSIYFCVYCVMLANDERPVLRSALVWMPSRALDQTRISNLMDSEL